MNHKGFTLIELMMAIAIAAVVLTMAIPSFIGSIRSNRVTTQANELITALNYARSEAVKRGVQVTVRRLSNTDRVWESGWEIFTDFNGDGTRNISGTSCAPGATGINDDCLLRTYAALPQGFTLRSGGNYAAWLAFRANGTSRSSSGLANDSFRLCDNSANINRARTINVNTVGRARVSQGAAECP